MSRSIVVENTVLREEDATRGGDCATMRGQVPVLRRYGHGMGCKHVLRGSSVCRKRRSAVMWARYGRWGMGVLVVVRGGVTYV